MGLLRRAVSVPATHAAHAPGRRDVYARRQIHNVPPEAKMGYYVGGDADDIAEEIQEGAKG